MAIVKQKFYPPIIQVIDRVKLFCEEHKYENILEIGPGNIPFPLAKKFVGYNEKVPNYIKVDIDEEPLPFQDKELDFIYCRHTLEDIQNPNFAFKEILRCAKSGYIETPSPLIESMKGVGIFEEQSKYYTGYFHHRYIIWSNMQKNEIYFLPKLNSITDNFIKIPKKYQEYVDNPYFWNNYFLFQEDKPPTMKMFKIDVNLGLKEASIKEYVDLLEKAINESIQNTIYFCSYY